jgi:hypothetical protein
MDAVKLMGEIILSSAEKKKMPGAWPAQSL